MSKTTILLLLLTVFSLAYSIAAISGMAQKRQAEVDRRLHMIGQILETGYMDRLTDEQLHKLHNPSMY